MGYSKKFCLFFSLQTRLFLSQWALLISESISNTYIPFLLYLGLAASPSSICLIWTNHVLFNSHKLNQMCNADSNSIRPKILELMYIALWCSFKGNGLTRYFISIISWFDVTWMICCPILCYSHYALPNHLSLQANFLRISLFSICFLGPFAFPGNTLYIVFVAN